MKHYNNSEQLDLDIWTVDYLTALDEFETGILSKEEKEQIHTDILANCTAKYGSYDRFISEIFGEPQS